MDILMAVVDFIPVGLFLTGALILMRNLYHNMSKGAFALFSAGNIFVFVAGLLKAFWKLLYYSNVCDFVALNQSFFPMQTIGFILAALGVVAMLVHKQGDDTKKLFAVPVFASSIPFVILMVLGVGVLYSSLAYISAKKKNYYCVACFSLALVFILAMGYLSSRDFTQAIFNWIAQLVNICGQGLFALGAYLLFRTPKNTQTNQTETNSQN